ncbi:MAG: hypothetical protein ACKOCI_06005, partial [Cyanobium sp.]
MHDLAAAFGGAALQGHRRPEPRLQGLALQGAAAEAVDGGDVGPVELLEGQQQAAPQLGGGIGPLAEQLEGHWRQSWQRFSALWPQQAETLEQNLAASASAAKAIGNEYRPYRLKPKPDKLQAVDAWLAGLERPPGYAALLERRELRDYFHPG